MSEQIFLNGAPVVGFGATEDEEKKYYATAVGIPLLGIVAGAGGGGVIGYKYGNGLGAVGGTLVGGIAGGVAGILVAGGILRAAAPPTTGVSGFGLGAALEPAPVAATPIAPWKEAIVASVVGAATSWAIDGAVRSVRRRKRRRRR